MPPPAAEHEAKAIAMDVKLFGKSRVAGQGSHRSEVGKLLSLGGLGYHSSGLALVFRL